MYIFFCLIILHIFINFILLICNKIINCSCLNFNDYPYINILQENYKQRTDLFKQNSITIFTKIYLYIIFILYLLIDLTRNIIWIYYKNDIKPRNKLYNKIDLFEFIRFLISILFYSFSSCLINILGDIINIIFLNYYIWRLILIFVTYLNEISIIKVKFSFIKSFNRKFIFFIFHFIEITIIYSFLYTTKYFNIFIGRNINTLLKTLNIFVSWNLVDKNLCNLQSLLVLTQIITFIIIFSFFIGNIINYKYKDEI
jgi:hypothetical protein